MCGQKKVFVMIGMFEKKKKSYTFISSGVLKVSGMSDFH